MMLGGSSRKDPGAPVLKKVSLPGGDGKHVFIPVNTKTSSQTIAMPGPQSSKGTNGSPRLVMVRGAAPNMSAPLKGQSILVPVNAPGGKIISAGGQTVGAPGIIGAGNKMPVMGGNFIKTMKGAPMISQGQLPKTVFPGNVISSTDSNKPVILMQSPQSSLPGGAQQILIPAPKGSKGGPFIMVPVSSTNSTTSVVSTSPSSQSLVKTHPSLKKPGVSLMPVNIGSPTQGSQISIGGQQFIRVPHPGVSSNKNLMHGKNSPVFIQSTQGGRMQFRMPPGLPANAKTVFVPDSALGSIPKGVQLIPISGYQGQKSAMQVSSSNLGALQGGKVIYVQSTPGAGGGKVVNYSHLQKSITTSGKNIVVVGGPGGKPIYSKSGNNMTKTVLRTVNTGGSNITYRNMGASHLPSMLNKPIKPKPVIETSDTFFKTPIEIKPLEEENDDDLDDVLNALQGNGHVDLVPVNTPSTHVSPPTPVTPPEDFGLRIDSVYSLSSDTEAISWDEKPTEEPSAKQSSMVTDSTSMEKSDSEEDDKDTEQGDQVDTNERHLKEVSTLSTEPLLPEDEPSQSGQPTSGQSEKTPQEETDMDIKDPNDDVGNKIEEDPNLMRGDCLQVRLAQQAARQLQEQMRQESERRSLVQAEWDEDMTNKHNDSGEKLATLSEEEQDDKQGSSEEEMEVDTECEGSPARSENGSEIDASKEADTKRDNDDDDLSDTKKKDEQQAATSEKQSDNDSKKTSDKTEAGDDVAKKALLAATLHGCEVADEDLNDMFDELISEYLTTPERPKPSVRVRGIDECKAFMEDSPQSLVTTTQHSSFQNLNTSLLPRSIPQLAMQQAMQQDSRMQPRQLKTAAGTITLIPVKVPVPGKPGETTIKYIPMQLPAGASGKSKAPMPQFIKIMPSTSKPGQTSQTVALSGATSGSPRFVKIVTSTTATKTVPQAITSVSTASGQSLLKMVLPTSNSTSVKPSSSTKDGGLSNEDMAKAIVGATRNVLGKSPVPAKPNIVYVQKPTGIMKGPLMSKMPVFLSQKAGKLTERIIIHPKTPASSEQSTFTAGGPASSEQSTFTAGGVGQNLLTKSVSEVPKKKKKKKKKRLKKWPKTKKCCVLLRKLNMKVIRNSSVNLKRVKKGFLFEAIPRQPRREAKRKAAEMEQSPEQPAAKRAKDDDGQALPMPITSSTVEGTSLTSVLNMPSTGMAVAGSKVHSLLTSSGILTSVPSCRSAAAMSGAPTLYRIMSQLPSIRPAVSGAPRPTPSQILNPSTLKMQSMVSTESMKNPVFSLLSKSAAALGLPDPIGSKTVATSPSSAITLTLSCTTASSHSTAIMSPQSVCTSSKASTILTATCSAPVLSPSVAGKSSVMSPPSKSQSSNSQGIQKAPEMPKMPTLLPAGARMMAPGQSSMRLPMPALHPAPRSLIVRGPSPALQSPPRPPLSVIRPRPPVAEPRMPVIIQPAEPGVMAAGASSQGGQPNPQPNKKYLLIKTSAGQFLVPVPVSRQGGASGAAGPTSTTTVAPSTLGSPVQLQVNLPIGGQMLQPAVSRAPAVAAAPAAAPAEAPSVTVPSRNAANNVSAPATSRTSAAQTSNILGPIKIKDEPNDTGYDKYEKPSVEDPTKTAIKEEKKGSDDEEDEEPSVAPDEADEEPPVAASVCHKQRIEELKARLREHEEQLLELKKKREDTKKILESLDNEQSD